MRMDGLRLADEWCDQFASGQVRRHLQQRLRRIHGGIFHQGGFGGIRLRQDKSAPAVHRAIGHGQRAAYRAQLAGQRKFSRVFVFGEFAGRYLSGRGEYAECDRQIEAPAFLGQIGGSEVDCDAARGKIELAILQRGAYAVFAFLHFSFRQADNREVGQTVGDVDLDGDQRCFHAGQCTAVKNREAHKFVIPAVSTLHSARRVANCLPLVQAGIQLIENFAHGATKSSLRRVGAAHVTSVIFTTAWAAPTLPKGR